MKLATKKRRKTLLAKLVHGHWQTDFIQPTEKGASLINLKRSLKIMFLFSKKKKKLAIINPQKNFPKCDLLFKKNLQFLNINLLKNTISTPVSCDFALIFLTQSDRMNVKAPLFKIAENLAKLGKPFCFISSTEDKYLLTANTNCYLLNTNQDLLDSLQPSLAKILRSEGG